MRLPGLAAGAAALSMFLAACGGGGGGGGAAEGGNSGGTEAPANADAPSYQLLTTGTGYPADQMAARTLSLGAYTLGLGQWAVDIAQRMTHPGTPLTVHTVCAYSGTTAAGGLDFTLDDRDGDGRASVGDVITVTMQGCATPSLLNRATGTMRIDVLAGSSAALDRSVLLRVSTQGDLALLGDLGDTVVSGALNVRWDEDATTQALRITTTGSEEWLFTSRTPPNNTRPDRVRRLDLLRQTDFAAAQRQASMAFVTDVNNGRGVLVVSTPQILAAPSLTASMTSGQVRIQGQEGHILADAQSGGFTYSLVNTALNQVSQRGGFSPSAVSRALAWNGHSQLAEQPLFDTEIPAWVEFDPNSIDCTTLASACPSLGTPVDRVFLQPVLPQPGITTAQAVFRLQLGLPLAAAQPALNFEFHDCAFDGVTSTAWNVPGVAERRGAFFLVRPQERLRQDRRYALWVYPSGQPLASAVVNLADGSTRVLRLVAPCVRTPSDLLVNLSSDAAAVVGPGGATTVRSQVSAAKGQAVTGYRWEQLGGAPVRLATPTAATTSVAYADAAPRLLDEVLLQLTAFDALGNEQRSRITLRAGDQVPSGPAAYFARQLADGSVRPDFNTSTRLELWNWPPDVSRGQLSFPGMGTLTFGTADGAPLAVRRYDGAFPSLVAGSHPSIDTALYPNDCLGAMTAWFDVRELVRGADGVPTRLALDFEVSCDAPRIPEIGLRLYGSYRYNSSLPWRY